MDVIAFCLVLLALAAYVAAPLYRRREPVAAPGEQQAVLARQDALSTALRDLEVDRASGLLDETSFEQERAALGAEADRLCGSAGDRTGPAAD